MKRLGVILLVVQFLITGCGESLSEKDSESLAQPVKKEARNAGLHYAGYSDKEFYGGIEKFKPENFVSEKMYGGIVSHHILVANEMTNFFGRISQQKPGTIVILGPNHFNLG